MSLGRPGVITNGRVTQIFVSELGRNWFRFMTCRQAVIPTNAGLSIGHVLYDEILVEYEYKISKKCYQNAD